MIMRFSGSYDSAIFFVGIFVVLFTTSHSNKFTLSSGRPSINEFYTTTYEGANLQTNHLQFGLAEENDRPVKTQQQEVNLKCDPLPKTGRYAELSEILSHDIFTQTDPFNYIMAQVKKISHMYYPHIKSVVDDALAKKQLPSCYIPYAILLSSFLPCWINLTSAHLSMVSIKTLRSANKDGYKSLLQEVSSSAELSELFSPDISSDPNLPTRLFNKFFYMPGDAIKSLKSQAQNFLHKWWGKHGKNLPFSILYVYYVNFLFELIQEKSSLGNLKRDIAEIQRKKTSDTGI